MTEPVADSLIPYDEIVQDALRSVVWRVLKRVEAEGLPGQHHFYIAFNTRAPGVSIPKRLMERYPDEMTIVIQHQYWDLAVDDLGFTIGLSFNQVPAKLRVPYAALTGFVDPAVNFALQFQAGSEGAVVPESQPDPEPQQDLGENVVAFDFKRKK